MPGFSYYPPNTTTILAIKASRSVSSRFAQTAREELDFAVLTAELVDAMRKTVQPEHISIWLKEPDWSDNAKKHRAPS
jgi:hypothetical protein